MYLQVVYGPDTKGNSEGDSTETEDKDRGISSIKGSSNTVTDFLSITTTRSRALRASETRSLFFEIQSSAFALIENQLYHLLFHFIKNTQNTRRCKELRF